ncbi:polymorphic outer membrane protein Pmp18D [Chlamydia abortus]|uniref:polymorphic outer membrane protein Pmp18D n=1 Tax=Chlamydia abortus TaxID=83555 RepID=UPI00091C57F8|nr:autotransporter domain-containing protein [Chlamydia abortus]ASD30882.1 Pmp family polymorphic membrane protein autotransporter adhesin [Chlamydia abortus]SGA00378.1 polymorphic outer membrane protein D family protein [Chlamydia abortus]SGA08217.1 polymorphic outer membrane protein D family protein [Chlamydia abortus]SGA09686.1 polymorphic outer membrane protein D family protein [Chlamydia abortus]SGA12639.1 polymorphic outer membrane protein D family protein [Chlamydia abortus]
MIEKKVSRFQKSTFSHSVVLAILVSTGMITNNDKLYGYVPASEVILDTLSMPKAELEVPSAGIFKKEKPIHAQGPKKGETDQETSLLDNTSTCVYKVLVAEDEQRQHLENTSTIFQTCNVLSWENLDTRSTNAEAEKGKTSPQYAVEDLQQGLAFCYKNAPEHLVDANTPGFLGIALKGTRMKSGLSFTNLKSTAAGAAVYSEEDVLFESFKEKLVFDGCESQAGGGAVSGRSIAIHGCHALTIANSKTDVELKPTSGESSDFSLGGGAFNANQVHPVHKSRFASGDVVFLDNQGSVLLSGNHADKANGGAVACGNFICSVNHSDIHYLDNYALSGGAVSSSKSMDFCGNLGSIEFLNNQALASSEGSLFLGGGALAAGERISFLNNHGILCSKNTAKCRGGALLSREVRIVENVGSSLFKENTAEVTGGAISSQHQVEIDQNFGNVTFEGNTSKFGGGAIYCLLPAQPDTDAQEPRIGSGDIKIVDNVGEVHFTSNANLLDSQETHSYLGGGALYGSNVLISGNIGAITFSKNQAGQCESSSTHIGGGAIFAHEVVTLSGNSGEVTFSYNKGQILPLPLSPTPAEESSTSNAPIESSTPVNLGVRGGGAIFAKSISVEDNSAFVSFSENSMEIRDNQAQKENPLGGGALFGLDSVGLKNNVDLAFSNNRVSGGNSSGGAILSKEVAIAHNGKVQFTRNCAKFLGGAVCALGDTLRIENNESTVSFVGNRTIAAGGALASAAGAVSISQNLGKVEFKDNFVFGDPYIENLEKGQINSEGHHSGGGAIFAKTSVVIRGNDNKVLFSGNSAGCFGGAILTGSLTSTESQERFAAKVESDNTKVVITENTGDVIFSGNSTTASKHPEHNLFGGGAIHTQDLIIKNNEGSVAFYNNYAPTGGAVRISEKGSVVLQALGGDIVFQGNRNSEDVSNGMYFSGKESKLVEVSAAGETSVIFSDAIVFEDLTLRKGTKDHEDALNDPTLIFNSKAKDDAEITHSGNVRFSHATSKIPQVALLESGTLMLSNKAQLWLCGLKQEKGSEILLSAGTVLRIFDPNAKPTEKIESPTSNVYYSAHESVKQPENKTLADINSIGIDLASFVSSDDETPVPPQIIVPKGMTIGSGSLDLNLLDSVGAGYENHALLGKETDITLLSFKSASSVLDTPDLDHALEELRVKVSVPTITEDTYGHMGRWSDPQVVDGKLMINWKPTSYKLNPEKSGAIVLNSLWGHCGDLRSLKQQQLAHNITAQRMELDFSTNIWGSGMGTFTNCATIGKVDGFTHRAGGYALGLDTQLIEDFLIGGSFAQFFGYTDSQSYSSRSDQSGYLGSGYLGIFTGSWLFKGMLIYSNMHNDLNTQYPQPNLGGSKGSWDSRGILADAHVDYRYIVNSRRLISSIVSAVVPFVEAEYVYVNFPKFTEIGSEARTFDEGHLQNVAIPFGVTLEHNYSRGQRSEVNSVSFSYAIDVYRQEPNVLIHLPEASYSWNGVGSNLARKSMKAQFSNDTEWNSYFSTFLGFTYEWREHTIAYDLNCGMRLIF